MACRVSGTTTQVARVLGKVERVLAEDARCAPYGTASCAKAWPSARSVITATKSCPGRMMRESNPKESKVVGPIGP